MAVIVLVGLAAPIAGSAVAVLALLLIGHMEVCLVGLVITVVMALAGVVLLATLVAAMGNLAAASLAVIEESHLSATLAAMGPMVEGGLVVGTVGVD